MLVKLTTGVKSCLIFKVPKTRIVMMTAGLLENVRTGKNVPDDFWCQKKRRTSPEIIASNIADLVDKSVAPIFHLILINEVAPSTRLAQK
jgi:hypothetical protein